VNRRAAIGVLALLASAPVLAVADSTLAPDVFAGAQDLAPIINKVRQEFPGVRQVDITEAQSLKPDVILDVREPEEFAVSRLDDATLAPDMQSALSALADTPRDALILTYCSVGWRSSKLAAALEAKGFSNVVNLEGSIFAWANRGLPVYRDHISVNDVHPFNWRWGRYLAPSLRTETPR